MWDVTEMMDRELLEHMARLLSGVFFGVLVIMLVAVLWWGMWMAKR